MIERSRKDVMQNMVYENLALISNRQIRLENICHTWISANIVDLHILETANASAYIFPLYLYLKQKKKAIIKQLMMFEPKEEY